MRFQEMPPSVTFKVPLNVVPRPPCRMSVKVPAMPPSNSTLCLRSKY